MSPSSATLIRESIEQAAHRVGHTLDDYQLAAVEALSRLGARVPLQSLASPRSPGGLYLWGTVGRGKTWLADAFFTALPTHRKRRLHFHAFYRELQRELYRDGPPKPGAIDDAIDDLLRGIDLLFFDEFHLHDAGDATLALRVLRRITSSGVALLATSNYPPSGLLPDPAFHQLFAPGIRLIEDTLEVVALEGSTDYRRTDSVDENRVGFARGAWVVGTLDARPTPDEAVRVPAAGHTFTTERATSDEVWWSFSAICESPSSAGDYIEWADRWPIWVIENVPPLTTTTPQARQRFLNLVDVLCDRGINATFSSNHTPDEVLAGGPPPTERGAAADREELGLGLDGLPIDVVRTSSRLALLRRVGEPATAQ